MKTIVLKGLTWDTENLVLNGKTHFTYRESLNIAKASGKRLPSKKELAKLFRLPHEWDNDKQGMWFAEHSEDLKGENSLFLPADGFRVYCDTTMSGVGESGYYWSHTPDGSNYAYDLVFNNSDTFMSSSVRKYGCSVRCVHIHIMKKKKKRMKLIKSKIKRDKPIGELPHGKVRITMLGGQPENIWVAKDEENKVMYLTNHALMFYPMPSWGMELPLTSGSIDLHKYRGDTFEETQFTVCEETYNGLKDFLDEEGNFDVEGYIAFCNSESDKASSTEE